MYNVSMKTSGITVTFHEDFHYPFATWALGTLEEPDGLRRAVLTLIPLRRPVSRHVAYSKQRSEWETAAEAASAGLAALITATPNKLRAVFGAYANGGFGVLPHEAPTVVHWQDVLDAAATA